MKVMCIKDSLDTGFSRGGKINKIPPELLVYFGEIYTVAYLVTGYRGQKLYTLVERPWNYRYKVEYFSPLSEIDEMEIVKEKKLEEA